MTADEAVRGGKTIPLKSIVDEAVQDCECVRRVFVSRRTGADVPMTQRDVDLEKVIFKNNFYMYMYMYMYIVYTLYMDNVYAI